MSHTPVTSDLYARTTEEPSCDFCGKILVVAQFQHMKSGKERNVCSRDTEYLRSRTDWVEEVSDG